MDRQMDDLPSSISETWPNGDRISLRLMHVLPKIWTQEVSRKFGIYWSDELNYGKLLPEPSEDELYKFYETDSYAKYLSGAGKGIISPNSIMDRIITKIAWLLDRSAPKIEDTLTLTGSERVCDIGCGSGALLSTLAPRVASVTGIDPSPVSINALKARGLEGYFGTAEDIPTESQTRKGLSSIRRL